MNRNWVQFWIKDTRETRPYYVPVNPTTHSIRRMAMTEAGASTQITVHHIDQRAGLSAQSFQTRDHYIEYTENTDRSIGRVLAGIMISFHIHYSHIITFSMLRILSF